MMLLPIVKVSRRNFLKATAAASLAAGTGLVLGFRIGTVSAQAAAPAEPAPNPNAFVRIGPDNSVTVISKHLEMGQGTYTGLATLVAEELDAAWEQVQVEGAPADAKLYNNLDWGPMQGTGGSSSIANSWLQMRRAGAAARAMLVAAAAKQWSVDPSSITVRAGVVASGDKKATFGELAAAAAREPLPAQVKLKDPGQFVLIGKQAPRKDVHEKTVGGAQFTLDSRPHGSTVVAVVAHAPRFGARVRGFDPKPAQAVPGVRYVVQIPTGVAVVAGDFWTARKGRDALAINWDESAALKISSAELLSQYKALAAKPGAVARSTGDIAKAFSSAARTIEAAYEFPYLAHATMEPMDCVVRLSKDRCEIWNGEQFQTSDQQNVANATGLKPEQVSIYMLYAGGSFGRRANPAADYVLEAVEIAKALAAQNVSNVPVKLVWTREDDMRGGYYRPAYYHAMKAALDAGGNVVAWQHRIVGQSILAGTPFESMMVKNGVDMTSVEGASTLPYAIPNMLVDLHSPRIGVPVLWWRSVGSTHTGYSTETFIDELARAARKDPVAFRRVLLEQHPRHLAVLDLAAKEAGWGSPLPPRKAGEKRGRGVAIVESFDTIVAEIAEVTVRGKKFSVDRVVCAVDCGTAVNPDNVRAQMEGGIGFGLSAALHGKITLKDGAVEQSNFHDYPVLRISEMPHVEVHIVPSTAKPTGVGEPGVPPIAPAVANALAAATGQRLRVLPLALA